MNGGRIGSEGLERVFTKYADLVSEQNANINNRIDDLASETGNIAKEMGNLIGIIGKSEERHNSHTQALDRIEKNQKEQGKDLKVYKQSNDDRVMEVEKQILLLDKETKINAKPWNNIKTIVVAVVGTLISGIILYISIG